MPPMEWLNYHHLLYFWTVARLGSVSRAGEELRLTQATVSAQLKSLETCAWRKAISQDRTTSDADRNRQNRLSLCR